MRDHPSTPTAGGGLAGAPGRFGARGLTPGRRNLAMTVLTLAIVLLSALAFIRTQVLKQEEPPIAGIQFDGTVTPDCECPRDAAKLSFTMERAQPITATVVDEEGEPVRTLLDGALRGSGRETITWNGTNDQGELVPEGEYRLRVELATPDRTITIPSDVTVEREQSATGSTGVDS